MKKIILCLAFVLGGVITSFGQVVNLEYLPLKVFIVEPTKPIKELPRTPIKKPSIAQDGHTFYFNNVGYDLTLALIDEDGEEAYTTFVPAGTPSIVLPSSLSGYYELQLCPDDSIYLFYADIML